MTSFFAKITLGLGIVTVLSSFSMAAAPLFINYQGKVTDSGGNPIPDPAVKVTFKFFSDPVQEDLGHFIGSYTANSIPVVNGVFSFPIPVSASWFSTTDVYLAISVNDGPLMAPRQRLVAAPYALSVGANSVDTGEIKDGAVTTQKIGTGAVTGPNIQAGAVSGGLNGTIADHSVDANDLKDDAVSGGLNGTIKDRTVDENDLKDGAVTGPKIQAGAVSGGVGGKIAASSVDTTNLKDGAVTKEKILGADLLDVYKTKGDGRLIFGTNYYSAVCDTDPSVKYYECGGSCGADTKPNSCTNAEKIGRLVDKP